MRCVVLHSGGLDSSVLLAHALQNGLEPVSLGVAYGQRHVRELEAGDRVASALGVERVKVDLTPLATSGVLAGSALTDEIAVPHGHYADESMKVTVVPNRNMLLLATATALAISRKADVVGYAAHAGDHAIYPDCRPEFADAMAQAMSCCDYSEVRLWRPYISWTKADIAKHGAAIEAPMALTWSCYEGGDVHCGRCGTCVERREAFAVAGVADPTTYEGE